MRAVPRAIPRVILLRAITVVWQVDAHSAAVHIDKVLPRSRTPALIVERGDAPAEAMATCVRHRVVCHTRGVGMRRDDRCASRSHEALPEGRGGSEGG